MATNSSRYKGARKKRAPPPVLITSIIFSQYRYLCRRAGGSGGSGGSGGVGVGLRFIILLPPC